MCLLVTPFLSIIEVLTLFSSIGNIDSSTMMLIKVVKDFLLFLCVILGLLSIRNRQIKISMYSFFLMFMSIVISIYLSIHTVSLLGIGAGIRWLLPFFLFFFIKKFEISFYIRLTLILELILLLGITLQGYQLFYMERLYGLSSFGLSLRNPGFYLIPSSMAAFAMVTLFFVMHFEISLFRKKLFYILSLYSVLLSASGTGLISFILITFAIFFRKDKIIIYSLAGIIFTIIIYIFLPSVSGRDDIWTSMYGRIDIFFENISYLNILFSDRFGSATNTFVSLRPDLLDAGGSVIADSMISASVINVGLLFTILFFYEFFFRPVFRFGNYFYLYFAVFAPFYFSVVIFELFPINILMFIAFSYLISSVKEAAKSNLAISPSLRAIKVLGGFNSCVNLHL